MAQKQGIDPAEQTLPPTPFSSQTQSPYNGLAPIYDQVMIHVNYYQWHRYILEIDRKYKFPSHHVLEIGGGTGKLASLFEGMDWNWLCSDRSLAMAAIARKQLAKRSWGPLVQDARLLGVRPGFGLVVFLYDGINYLRSEDHFVQCLRQAESVLTSGGYFLFDVTTEANSLTHFKDYTYYEDLDEAFYVRRSFYDSIDKMQHNHFHIFERKNGAYSRHIENHSQRLYSLSQISAMIGKSGLQLVGKWNGYGFARATRTSERVHFLLRKT